MGIGGAIFLIALGAVIAFALDLDAGLVDLSLVGWLPMLAGLVGLVGTLWTWINRRRRTATADRHDAG